MAVIACHDKLTGERRGERGRREETEESDAPQDSGGEQISALWEPRRTQSECSPYRLFLVFLIAPEAFLKLKKVRFLFSNVRTLLNLAIKPKTLSTMPFLDPNLNVRLVPLSLQ